MPAKVKINAAQTCFYLSLAPVPPEISLSATTEGVGSVAVPSTSFMWQFSLSYPGFIAVHGGRARNARAKLHPPMPPAAGNRVRVPLTTVMGGVLTATVTVTVGGQTLTACRDDLLIGGTNPTAADLLGVVPVELVRKMVQQESGIKQFSGTATAAWTAQAIHPNWSGDGLRGVGLGQLTVPPPIDPDIGGWRANALQLQQQCEGKRRSAATLHTRKDRAGRLIALPRVPVVDDAGQVSWPQVTGDERVERSGGSAPGQPHYIDRVLAQPG